MKVLVLGHKGMLGHMVTRYLRDNKVEVVTSDARWPESPFKSDMKLDYVINCIGAIPQRTKSFDINWHLPIWLDFNSPCRVIHPGTDCEMDDDDYGKSKKIAADFLNSIGTQTKILKTSIIGPEINGNASLLEWFLSQNNEVFGYTKAKWNGNTTLEWAKQCLSLMFNWDDYQEETILEGQCVSKYELLNTIKDVFNVDVRVNPKEDGNDKCLVGYIKTVNIKEQLKELKKYYYDNN
jgi:dTDP-4-dehydrorhamnose reductase